jgi:hypothetical protein
MRLTVVKRLAAPATPINAKREEVKTNEIPETGS